MFVAFWYDVRRVSVVPSPLLAAAVLRVNTLSPFFASLAGGSPAFALLGSRGAAPHPFIFLL